MHSIPITIPGAPHNFILTYIHSQLSSLAYSTKLTHQSSESATSAVSSANNCWRFSKLQPFVFSSSSPFPSTLTFTSQTTRFIYTLINHAWTHHTALSQSNINLELLTHIFSHTDTRPTTYIKTVHCFQQFSSNSKSKS